LVKVIQAINMLIRLIVNTTKINEYKTNLDYHDSRKLEMQSGSMQKRFNSLI